MGWGWGHWFPHASQDSWGLMRIADPLFLSLSLSLSHSHTHTHTHTYAFAHLLQQVGGSGEVQAGLRFNTHLSSPLVAQTVKNLPARWESLVGSLGQEDPLEKGMASHSCILAWRIPGTKNPGWLTVYGVPKSGTQLSG